MLRTTIDGVTGACVLSAALVLMGAAPLSAQARLPIGTSVPYHLNSPWQGGLSGK